MAAERVEQAPRRGVPETRRPVEGGRQDAPVVGGEGDAREPVLVAIEHVERYAALEVQDVHLPPHTGDGAAAPPGVQRGHGEERALDPRRDHAFGDGDGVEGIEQYVVGERPRPPLGALDGEQEGDGGVAWQPRGGVRDEPRAFRALEAVHESEARLLLGVALRLRTLGRLRRFRARLGLAEPRLPFLLGRALRGVALGDGLGLGRESRVALVAGLDVAHEGEDHAGQDRRGGDRARDHAGLVAPHELRARGTPCSAGGPRRARPARWRSTSAASAAAVVVAAGAVLLQRLHHDPVEVAADQPCRAASAAVWRLLARSSGSSSPSVLTAACWAAAGRPRGSSGASRRSPARAGSSMSKGVVPVSSS